ncbi:MAG: SHOCT domain-containing protein [Candidatus Loosdrechtia sp.]|uniref:SHOCT domain-containing protein n=1 Tax=Candidatus Loosdrechtia sp. TaxID=3101272 RepID=UPI003A5DC486|nr:MAG: SHOCT domain-containing protein [Candidatus Jettenia sp. AMX2]
MGFQKLRHITVLTGIGIILFICFLQDIHAEIYQSGKITVQHEEMPVRKNRRPIRFEHPYTLSGDVLTNVLSYTYYEEKGFLKSKESQRVFEDDEIRILVPLIIQAFSVAEPNQVILVSSYSERMILSDKQNYFILFITDNQLHMVFSRVRALQTFNDNMSAKRIYTQTRENPSRMKQSSFWKLIPAAGKQLKLQHENWLIADLYHETYQQPVARRIGTVDEKIKMETSDLDARLKKLEEMVGSGMDRVSDKPETAGFPVSAGRIHGESEIREKLIVLHEMVNEGLLSQEDYDYKKAELLKEAMTDMAGMGIRDQLRQLKDLKLDGFITEDDYNRKKKELLDQF